jgi:hypothetical protein
MTRLGGYKHHDPPAHAHGASSWSMRPASYLPGHNLPTGARPRHAPHAGRPHSDPTQATPSLPPAIPGPRGRCGRPRLAANRARPATVQAKPVAPSCPRPPPYRGATGYTCTVSAGPSRAATGPSRAVAAGRERSRGVGPPSPSRGASLALHGLERRRSGCGGEVAVTVSR